MRRVPSSAWETDSASSEGPPVVSVRVRIAYKSPSLHDPFTVPSSQMPAAASASARIRLMVRRIGPMQPVWLEDYKLRMIAHGPENVFYRGRGNLHLGGAVSPGADAGQSTSGIGRYRCGSAGLASSSPEASLFSGLDSRRSQRTNHAGMTSGAMESDHGK